MVEKSLSVDDLKTICRLCLSTGGTVDIFQFSAKIKNRVVDAIMKCAPVQIEKCDDMPNFICRSCYTKLKKNYQFQMQVVQSEKTLRYYLHRINASDKKIKTERSGDFFIHDTKAPISTGYADDTVETFCNDDERNDSKSIEVNDIDREEKEPVNFIPEIKIKEETASDFEMKNEPIDDNPQTTDYNGEIICEDTKIDIDHTWDVFDDHRSTDATEDFDKREDDSKNTSVNIEINKKTSKIAYTCDFCDKSFPYPSALCNHTRVHTGEKPYRCDVCNKCFARSTDLNTHKRTHTGDKPYRCDVCNRHFSRSQHLKSHARTHSGEKPYQCDVCNKQFIQLQYLKKHKRTHTGEKPYRCEVCNKCFARSTDLIVHKRTHTGEKPYRCDVCNRCFSQSQHLRGHELTHTGEKPYRCDVCNKCFTRSTDLNTHKRTHTNEKPC